jgi:hypothetical protein
MKLSAIERFQDAIKSAALDADSKSTSAQVAWDFYREQRPMIEPYFADWIVEKLGSLIGKHRAKVRRENNQQLVLEGVVGISGLPRKLPAKSGDKVLRGDATIGTFRHYRGQLWKQGNPGIANVDKAIALMSEYVKKEPRITWAEVVKREAEKKGKART